MLKHFVVTKLRINNSYSSIRILSQVSSACSCERSWSNYDFIHNKRRNRLTPSRARDLVWVFINLRLVEKMECAISKEKFVSWAEEEEEEEF